MEERVINISMPLPTHVAKTNNKKAPNKYWKVNYQDIYSGNLHHFSRVVVVENMHHFIINSLKSDVLDLKIHKTIRIEYIFHTVINHGDIRRRLGKTLWKPAPIDYQVTWDLNNLSDIWVKTGNDALTLAGVLVDDNAGVIRKSSSEFIIVDHIDDLELEINIIY